MRDGRVQQVDIPQRLYDSPTNVFVGAFIGSPAMNLVAARIEDDHVAIADLRIPLDRARRPEGVEDSRVVVGIRPEAFEDAAFAESGLPQFDVRVEVVEELGSDAFVFFEVDSEPIVIEGAQSDDASERTTLLAQQEQHALFAARVDPRTKAQVGEVTRLAVDPARMYFFSPQTGESLLGGRTAAAASA
jgi:multiple sugar transport system ATP-binding protein